MADGSEARVRQRFTGYERDGETQLDFAEARMYQNRHGRFTAHDPLLASASAANPQTFNRYIYTGNNPVNITDPSGLNWCRNDETAVTGWTGGAACGTGFTNMTGRTGTNIGDSCYTQANGSCRYYERNSSVRFNSNGTTSGRDLPTISENPEVEVTDTASQEIASAGASELWTSMNQRPLAAIPLTCPVSVSSCKSSSSPGYQRLDTANASKPNTVKGMELMLEACSILSGLGLSCSVVNIIIKAGSGDISGAGEELLFATLPGSKLLKQADKAADVAKGAHAVYHGVDAAGVVRYVGITSRGVATRADEHLSAIGTGKEFLRYEVVKGAQGLTKMQARIWEQRLILKHGLGKYGGTLLNKRNEIAQKYWKRYGIDP